MIWEAVEEDAARVRPAGGGLSEWRFIESRPVLCREQSTDDGGRAVVSAESVARGVCVLKERACAFVTTTNCAVCLQRAKRRCGCGTRWCSSACQEKDDHPCAALDLLRRLESERDESSCRADFEALRLATRMWTSGKTKTEEFLRLCDHREALVDAARRGDGCAESALASAHVGATLVATSLRCDDESQLVLSLLKIRFNAFPVALVEGGTSLALFLRASALNHSCSPNSSLSIHPSKDNTLVLEARAHVDLCRGTELTISYLSLQALLSERRRETLRESFFFDCACEKCSSTSQSDHDREMKNRALDTATEDLLKSLKTKDAHKARDASRRIEAVLSSVSAGAAVDPARAKLRLVAAKSLLETAAEETLSLSLAALDDLVIACGPYDLATRSAAALATTAREQLRHTQRGVTRS